MNKIIMRLYIILPFIFPFLLLTKNEWVIALGICVLIAATLLMGYRTREWIVLIVGIIFGILAEIGGDMIYKLQYWEQGSFFGIPVWLPFLWGYGFLYIGRISALIVKGKR